MEGLSCNLLELGDVGKRLHSTALVVADIELDWVSLSEGAAQFMILDWLLWHHLWSFAAAAVFPVTRAIASTAAIWSFMVPGILVPAFVSPAVAVAAAAAIVASTAAVLSTIAGQKQRVVPGPGVAVIGDFTERRTRLDHDHAVRRRYDVGKFIQAVVD